MKRNRKYKKGEMRSRSTQRALEDSAKPGARERNVHARTRFNGVDGQSGVFVRQRNAALQQIRPHFGSCVLQERTSVCRKLPETTERTALHLFVHVRIETIRKTHGRTRLGEKLSERRGTGTDAHFVHPRKARPFRRHVQMTESFRTRRQRPSGVVVTRGERSPKTLMKTVQRTLSRIAKVIPMRTTRPLIL